MHTCAYAGTCVQACSVCSHVYKLDTHTQCPVCIHRVTHIQADLRSHVPTRGHRRCALGTLELWPCTARLSLLRVAWHQASLREPGTAFPCLLGPAHTGDSGACSRCAGPTPAASSSVEKQSGDCPTAPAIKHISFVHWRLLCPGRTCPRLPHTGRSHGGGGHGCPDTVTVGQARAATPMTRADSPRLPERF